VGKKHCQCRNHGVTPASSDGSHWYGGPTGEKSYFGSEEAPMVALRLWVLM